MTGAGKGTLAQRLTARLGLVHLSTGAILRAAVERGNHLGETVQPFVERGELVPDDLMLAVVEVALARPDVMERGYLLDGFPRTVEQAEAFLAGYPDGIDAAIELIVDPDEARRRLLARGRDDDDPGVIDRRLAVHDDETGSLLAYLRDRGLLVEVDGHGDPDTVLARACAALGADCA
jgi:adenylate kinase